MNFTRLRWSGPKKDKYGKRTTTAPTETTLGARALGPVTSEELQESNREGIVHEFTLYCPPGIDLTNLDDVKIDNQIYEITDGPRQWRSPYGAELDGDVFALRRAEG